jgi:hypothetical protein
MANPNTTECVGIRRSFSGLDAAGPGYRCYEPNGGALYKSNRDKLDYLGTNYATAVTIPFDITTSSPNRYSLDSYMEQLFNAGMIYPIT